jgi:hypothetical protein
MDGQSLSVVRPTVSFQPAREIIARHSSPQNETNPKFVLDPVIYASAARQAARKANAAPAGAGSDRSMLYFGNVEHCSYTQLVKISGPGMIPRYDVPAALAHEFMTAHEFAYQFDEFRGKAGSPSSRERRRIESFADAFAVTELILAGRSLKDIDRIVACREAAIIGLAGARGRTKGSADAIVSLSGAAARAALNAAYTVVQNGGYVDAVALVQQATRISERHTISDKGMKELQSALARLSTDATQAEMSRWLKNLAAATTDEALSLTASSLAKASTPHWIRNPPTWPRRSEAFMPKACGGTLPIPRKMVWLPARMVSSLRTKAVSGKLPQKDFWVDWHASSGSLRISRQLSEAT